MIFCHKLYENLNYTNLSKNNPNDICPKPKKLYKLYNAKKKKKKKTKKKKKKKKKNL